MTTFLIIAAAMTLIAIAFVAWPLWRQPVAAPAAEHDAANLAIYRDQLLELETDRENGTLPAEQFEQARHELERRLLQDLPQTTSSAPAVRTQRWPALAIALAVPLIAGGLYWQIGNPDGLNPPQQPAMDPAVAEQVRQIEESIAKLEAHVKEKPDNADAWAMLGRAHAMLSHMPEAMKAYERATELKPRDADLLTDYAEVLGLAHGQSLAGKPWELIQQALKLDPKNQKALALAGSAMFEQQQFKEALKYWEKLLAMLPPNGPGTEELRAAIADARQQSGQPAPSAPAASSAAVSVSGTVTLSPSLAGKVAPTDTVFIFARAAQGPRMPLAIMRIQVKDLPTQFTLDDSMAMSPQMKLSGFDQVVVGARVSKSGNAMPQPGDLEGASAPLKPGAKDIAISIDRVVQ